MAMMKNAVDVTQHIQDTPSSTWQVKHGRPGYPIVDVYMELDGKVQKVIPAGVTYIDEYNIEVLFSEPRTGFVTVVV